ncbi:MAG: hypothetical protein QOD99_608 [Chthoniobacter sp.]|nr:hypothetical protein [Chthoniobacter sp.]
MSDGKTSYRIVCTAPVDVPYMGKPISKLVDSEYIQTKLGFVNTDTVVTGGSVVGVINNTITLDFIIPAQTTGSNGIMIPNLSDGLKPLRRSL